MSNYSKAFEDALKNGNIIPAEDTFLQLSEANPVYMGVLISHREVTSSSTNKDFNIYRFIGAEGYDCISGGAKLHQLLQDIPEKISLVAIKYLGEIDTGKPQPMRDYQVEYIKIDPSMLTDRQKELLENA